MFVQVTEIYLFHVHVNNIICIIKYTISFIKLKKLSH